MPRTDIDNENAKHQMECVFIKEKKLTPCMCGAGCTYVQAVLRQKKNPKLHPNRPCCGAAKVFIWVRKSQVKLNPEKKLRGEQEMELAEQTDIDQIHR